MLHAIVLSTAMWLATPAPLEMPPLLPYQPPTQISEPSVSGQLGAELLRVFLSLGLVVGLIYLLSKVALPRMLRLSNQRNGRVLWVVERAQLDGKNSAVIIDVAGEGRFLVATGEKGVNLISRLGKQPDPTSEVE